MYTLGVETCPNRLRLQTVLLPQVHTAVFACFVKIGPRYERDDETGLSHFVEHMLFKGTAAYPDSRALSAAFEDLGGEFNGFTQQEYTHFVVRVHRDHVRRGLEIFSELFRSPRFNPPDVEVEKRIVEQELCGYGGADARFPLDEFLWPGLRGHGNPLGTAEQIRGYTRDRVRAFFERYYRPRQMVLTVAGAFDEAEVRGTVAETFARLPDAPVELPAAEDAPALGPRFAHEARPGPSCAACVAHLTPSYLHPDLTAILIIDAILGLGTSSRLFRNVRERRGLAYDLNSGTHLFSDRGILTLSLASDGRRLAEGVEALFEEVALLRDQGVAPAELARIRERVRCEMEYKLDEPDEMASWFGTQAILLPPEAQRMPEDELQRVREVDDAELGRVLRTLFTSERRYVVTEGPVPWRQRRRIERLALGG
jgi:predicted Zn-dependent peptidase